MSEALPVIDVAAGVNASGAGGNQGPAASLQVLGGLPMPPPTASFPQLLTQNLGRLRVNGVPAGVDPRFASGPPPDVGDPASGKLPLAVGNSLPRMVPAGQPLPENPARLIGQSSTPASPAPEGEPQVGLGTADAQRTPHLPPPLPAPEPPGFGHPTPAEDARSSPDHDLGEIPPERISTPTVSVGSLRTAVDGSAHIAPPAAAPPPVPDVRTRPQIAMRSPAAGVRDNAPPTPLPQLEPPGGNPALRSEGLVSSHTENWSVVVGPRLGSASPLELVPSLPQSPMPNLASVPPMVAVSGTPPSAAPIIANPTTASSPGAIDIPMTHPGFETELNGRITWMARHHVQHAEIRLNPPHLGPLEVHVSVAKGEAQVTFVTPHAAVRDVLEAAIPRLREGFGEQGLSLTQADVTEHSYRDREHHRPQFLGDEAPSEADAGGDTGLGHEPAAAGRSAALLDVYV